MMVAPNLALIANTESRPRNRLFAALPDEALWSLRPHLRTVPLPRGSVLCESGERLRRAYFPEAGAISLVTVFEDGSTAEMATVGREGVIGVGALLGGEHAFGRHVVSVAGSALAVEASRFRSALRENRALRAACETYAQAFLAHLLQNVACNAIHKVDQRCARWLLMCHDQAEGGSFELTQEYLAEMLGVRRSTVTVTAGNLQREGLIHYRRGAMTVLDRRGLETTACKCYHIVRDTYERPLPPVSPSRPPSREMAATG